AQNQKLRRSEAPKVTTTSHRLRMRNAGEMMRFLDDDCLTCQLFQELLLVHAVFERLAAINENDWDLVGELTTQEVVSLDVNFAPTEPSPALKLYQFFFHDFAQVATFAGVHNDFAME